MWRLSRAVAAFLVLAFPGSMGIASAAAPSLAATRAPSSERPPSISSAIPTDAVDLTEPTRSRPIEIGISWVVPGDRPNAPDLVPSYLLFEGRLESDGTNATVTLPGNLWEPALRDRLGRHLGEVELVRGSVSDYVLIVETQSCIVRGGFSFEVARLDGGPPPEPLALRYRVQSNIAAGSTNGYLFGPFCHPGPETCIAFTGRDWDPATGTVLLNGALMGGGGFQALFVQELVRLRELD